MASTTAEPNVDDLVHLTLSPKDGDVWSGTEDEGEGDGDGDGDECETKGAVTKVPGRSRSHKHKLPTSEPQHSDHDDASGARTPGLKITVMTEVTETVTTASAADENLLDDYDYVPGHSPNKKYTPLDPEVLPPNLAKLVEDGYRLSSSSPHYLKAIATACIGHRNGHVGIGVWWSDEGHAQGRNICERAFSDDLDQGAASLFAVIRAIEQCPHPELPLEIDTGDEYVWTTVNNTIHKWQSNWFTDTFEADPNRKLISHFIALLREREHPVRFKFIRGHHGSHAAFDLARTASASMRKKPVEMAWKSADKYVNEAPRKAKHVSITRSILI